MLPPKTRAQSNLVRLGPIKNNQADNQLLIHEIFASIQGESSYAGEPCVFIRTTGCHLRCAYCDTEHAFFKGELLDLDDIIRKAKSYNIKLVELTGGEPLLHKESFNLLRKLCDAGFEVLLETSGAVSISKVDPRVKIILDIKTPGSGEEARNNYKNLESLNNLENFPNNQTEIKFVMCDRADYDFAKGILKKYDLIHNRILFSPANPGLKPEDLVSWLNTDKFNKSIGLEYDIRLNLQLHKYIWGDKPGV